MVEEGLEVEVLVDEVGHLIVKGKLPLPPRDGIDADVAPSGLVEKVSAKGGGFKKAVEIGAPDVAVAVTFGLSVLLQAGRQRTVLMSPFRTQAHVDFVGLPGVAFPCGPDLTDGFLGRVSGADGKEAETGPGGGVARSAGGVGDRFAEDLVATANAGDGGTVAGFFDDGVGEPGFTKPAEVGKGVLRAGDDDGVGLGKGFGTVHPLHRDAFIVAEGIEVAGVGSTGEANGGDHGDAGREGLLNGGAEAVFGLGLKVTAVGKDAEVGDAGNVLSEVAGGLREEGGVTAEFINDEAEPAVLKRGGEEVMGADELGEDSPALNIADENPVPIGVAEGPEVGDVAVHEVELDGTARSFDEKEVSAFPPPPEGRFDVLPKLRDFGVVVGCGKVLAGLAEHHQLRAFFAAGLEENGVHVGFGKEAARLGLHRLSPANLASVGGGIGIVGHVLRLERSHTDAPLAQTGAKGGGEPAFAAVGGGAEDGEGFHGR